MIRRALFNITYLFVASVCLPPANSFAQEKPFDPILTLDRIFTSDDFRQESFGPARWMKDGDSYTTLERSEKTKSGRDVIHYSAGSGKREVLVPASLLVPPGDTLPLRIENYQWSADEKKLLVFTNSKRVWRQNTKGEYWVLDLGDGHLTKLGQKLDPSTLMFAKLSPDGARAAYVYENNIYVETIADGHVVQLTHDGSGTIINGNFDWVYEEEFEIRDGFRWSPDGTSIAFWQLDSKGVRDFHMINNTDSLYPQVITFKYPKVGETNSACRIGVVPSAGGDIVWLRVPGDPRNTYIPRMEWARNSKEIVLQHLNRLQNRNDVILADIATGEIRIVMTDSDRAWVDVMDDLYWINDGEAFTWASEKDGWRHIYLVSRKDGREKLVTPGEFDVIHVEAVDKKGEWLYYIASPDNPTQRYLYRVRFDGKGKPERLSPLGQPGTHSYQFSPSMKWAFHTFSNINKPPVIELVQLPKHSVARTMVTNNEYKEKMGKLNMRPVEFFRIDIGGEVLLDGWCMKPPDFDSTKKYPLFFTVYGEPAGQTVLDRWNGSLWDIMLAQQGYILVSIDNRGTPAPRGRGWRKSIYRQIGILASADQSAAARALLGKWRFADSSRVGIWGWSGGGSMTLNAMFRYPDLYKTGIAVAFVSNQRYYDDIYQERYMGLPDDNAAGFRDGSPITFAKNLKGNLLIVHGSGDDNVHFQNFEALVNELVANNKHFTMMEYPNRSHGIYEGRGTSRHLYELFTWYLNQNLPPGPKER
jgi:dipeptidyl-peptidase-4